MNLDNVFVYKQYIIVGFLPEYSYILGIYWVLITLAQSRL